MHNKDIILMKNRDAERLRIIQKVMDHGLTQVDAGVTLGLSERQIRRLMKRVRAEGPVGMIHRSRGRHSLRRFREAVKAKVLGLIKRRYADFGPTLAVETMQEKGEADVSRETLRKWMIEDGLWQVRRKKRAVHAWRERKAHVGEMVQMDGSHHDWLEGRGPKMVLMSYIDDATGRSWGRFYEYEGVYPAMDSLRRYLGRSGHDPVRAGTQGVGDARHPRALPAGQGPCRTIVPNASGSAGQGHAAGRDRDSRGRESVPGGLLAEVQREVR
jgi:hypothetical protein